MAIGKSYRSLSAPFSEKRSLLAAPQIHHPVAVLRDHQLLRPRVEVRNFLEIELKTPKLDQIFRHLWLSGLPRPARPLHRQLLMNRTIVVTESPDEHLVWHESRIYIKPIPEYLLVHGFWQNFLCADEELHKCACGLLLSYAWLVCYKSDLRIAKQAGLLPEEIDWASWTGFMEDFLSRIDSHKLHQVDRRYQYGELRLSRLNSLYRFAPSVFSVRNLVYGFMSRSTWYKAFFERNFAWLLAAFVYVSVMLSAMQVGLATDKSHGNSGFQRASYAFALASIMVVLVVIGCIFLLWFVLFWYHLGSTIIYWKRVGKEAEMQVECQE